MHIRNVCILLPLIYIHFINSYRLVNEAEYVAEGVEETVLYPAGQQALLCEGKVYVLYDETHTHNHKIHI